MSKLHYTLTTINLILNVIIIISLILMLQNVSLIKSDLKDTKVYFEEGIIENQRQTQDQISQLTENILLTQSDLELQISQLKAETSADFSGIIQNVIPGVVSVATDISQGSGFIISEDGYVITNAHVLSGGRYARVLTYDDLQWINAELVGYNTEMDVAILKIPDNNYDYLSFGDSSNLKVGEKAIALGNPLGLSFSVSEGIISGLDRIGPNNLPIYIQIDTPLNRGNSGGPLVSKEGKVIGINNFKLQGSENLGFALESDEAVKTINAIFSQQSISLEV
ncbi:MAG TPA: trypsin-like peptidase domain-containing protein [Candidatus Nanoarchaeia archaeon]|nr:trypsin-like peptidase domain-containing protein [Candidatus Nanoarchaeia archaeon]